MKRALLLMASLLLVSSAVAQKAYNTYYGFRGGMTIPQAKNNAELMGAVCAGEEDNGKFYIVAYNGGKMQAVTLSTTVLFFESSTGYLVSIALTPIIWENMPGLEAANQRVRLEASSFGKSAGMQPDYWYDPDGTLNAGFYVNGMKVHISAMSHEGQYALGLFVFFKEGKNT